MVRMKLLSCIITILSIYIIIEHNLQIKSFNLFIFRGQSHGAITTLLVTLAQPYTRVELEFLSIYHPNAEEIEDAKFYANNLRQHMANALKVPTSDLTFNQAKEKYAKKLKRMESIKKDKDT